VSDRIDALGGRGVLTAEDLESLSEAARRVETLMRDGRWHRAGEIIAVARQREGLRRLRELRANPRYGVEKRRLPGVRDFEYRLVVSEPGQRSLW
jgi:hypothetical protein